MFKRLLIRHDLTMPWSHHGNRDIRWHAIDVDIPDTSEAMMFHKLILVFVVCMLIM